MKFLKSLGELSFLLAGLLLDVVKGAALAQETPHENEVIACSWWPDEPFSHSVMRRGSPVYTYPSTMAETYDRCCLLPLLLWPYTRCAIRASFSLWLLHSATTLGRKKLKSSLNGAIFRSTFEIVGWLSIKLIFANNPLSQQWRVFQSHKTCSLLTVEKRQRASKQGNNAKFLWCFVPRDDAATVSPFSSCSEILPNCGGGTQ